MANYFQVPSELQGAQADVLWELISANPNLIRRPAASVNQQLNTKNSRVIAAINEVKSQADTATLSVTEALTYVNSVVGDAGDDVIKQKLEDLGGNVIEAAYDLKQKLDVIDGGTF